MKRILASLLVTGLTLAAVNSHAADSKIVIAMLPKAKGNAYFSPSILKRLLELYRDSSGNSKQQHRGNGSCCARKQCPSGVEQHP